METSGGSALDPNQTPDAEGPMKRLVADDPVRVVRTIFREIDDQAIDRVLYRGKGGVGVRERFKVLGSFELQHGVFSGHKKTRTRRVIGGLGIF